MLETINRKYLARARWKQKITNLTNRIILKTSDDDEVDQSALTRNARQVSSSSVLTATYCNVSGTSVSVHTLQWLKLIQLPLGSLSTSTALDVWERCTTQFLESMLDAVSQLLDISKRGH